MLSRDTELQMRTRLLKAREGIKYKEIAEYMEMPTKSFYSWLNGAYYFSEDRKNKLEDILSILEVKAEDKRQ
ncbi:MAG: hypothetical protein MJ237_09115 [bacterium]|nr:hypothetical protein [bacterium]